MFYYKIAELTVRSFCRLAFFESFACEPGGPDVVLEQAERLPEPGGDLVSGVLSGDFVFSRLEDGWVFHTRQDENALRGLYVSEDYTWLPEQRSSVFSPAGLWKMHACSMIFCRSILPELPARFLTQ